MGPNSDHVCAEEGTARNLNPYTRNYGRIQAGYGRAGKQSLTEGAGSAIVLTAPTSFPITVKYPPCSSTEGFQTTTVKIPGPGSCFDKHLAAPSVSVPLSQKRHI